MDDTDGAAVGRCIGECVDTSMGIRVVGNEVMMGESVIGESVGLRVDGSAGGLSVGTSVGGTPAIVLGGGVGSALRHAPLVCPRYSALQQASCDA